MAFNCDSFVYELNESSISIRTHTQAHTHTNTQPQLQETYFTYLYILNICIIKIIIMKQFLIIAQCSINCLQQILSNSSFRISKMHPFTAAKNIIVVKYSYLSSIISRDEFFHFQKWKTQSPLFFLNYEILYSKEKENNGVYTLISTFLLAVHTR